MELGVDWAQWGLLGLFLAAFLAATILPFSSEAVLAAMALGSWSFASLLLVASIGNTLGGLTNYAIGRWVPHEKLVKRLGIDATKTERWRSFVQRYGAWGALACWLPVIGDPIALALGVVRSRLFPTAVLMLVGKTVRYAMVLGVLRGILTL